MQPGAQGSSAWGRLHASTLAAARSRCMQHGPLTAACTRHCSFDQRRLLPPPAYGPARPKFLGLLCAQTPCRAATPTCGRPPTAPTLGTPSARRQTSTPGDSREACVRWKCIAGCVCVRTCMRCGTVRCSAAGQLVASDLCRQESKLTWGPPPWQGAGNTACLCGAAGPGVDWPAKHHGRPL